MEPKSNTPEKSANPEFANILAWLSDERAEKYFGRAFKIKAAILAHIISGESSLPEIARANRVSRQAVHDHASKARAIYFQ